MPEDLLGGLATVLILGIGAQWLAWRVRLPNFSLAGAKLSERQRKAPPLYE